jgi:hypothetical protein
MDCLAWMQTNLLYFETGLLINNFYFLKFMVKVKLGMWEIN